jgi:hypothetical protein
MGGASHGVIEMAPVEIDRANRPVAAIPAKAPKDARAMSASFIGARPRAQL